MSLVEALQISGREPSLQLSPEVVPLSFGLQRRTGLCGSFDEYGNNSRPQSRFTDEREVVGECVDEGSEKLRHEVRIAIGHPLECGPAARELLVHIAGQFDPLTVRVAA